MALLSLAMVAIVLITSLRNKDKNPDQPQDTQQELYEDDNLSYRNITYDGKSYTFKPGITTILFMGIDQHDVVVENGYEGTGGRSDCLILYIIDSKNNTARMLEISRDTMVNVAVYDVDGEYALDMPMQITMQYAYGDGANKSCRLTKEAVSELLYGIPIDNFLSMNIDGISTVTDALGGVTITIPEDYTQIDPSFIKGSTVTLDGAQAEKYVRTRDITVTGSNDMRMERQMQFVKALVAQMQDSSNGLSVYKEIFDKASPYIVTDMDSEDMYALTKYNLDTEECKVPGKTVEGVANDEYHVDEDALRRLLIDLFYDEN